MFGRFIFLSIIYAFICNCLSGLTVCQARSVIHRYRAAGGGAGAGLDCHWSDSKARG